MVLTHIGVSLGPPLHDVSEKLFPFRSFEIQPPGGKAVRLSSLDELRQFMEAEHAAFRPLLEQSRASRVDPPARHFQEVPNFYRQVQTTLNETATALAHAENASEDPHRLEQMAFSRL